MVTQLPGFTDTVHDAQITFRALLNALARPGIIQTTVSPSHPAGLEPGCAAACLALLDLETVVWLQPGFTEDIRPWLVFHTGCRFTENPQSANFALIKDINSALKLSEFSWGTGEYPESSTSLLLQLSGLTGGENVILQGPGILDTIETDLPLSSIFWQQWEAMAVEYPLGLDCWFFSQNQVVGLPRTAKLMTTFQGA
ncbi:MAG: phosphonate C-P lyase system protein PhnH [Cyanobacteria bacterium P01_H01_bin.105]